MAVGDLKQPSHCLRRCHCGCRGVELGKKLATACRSTIDGIYSRQCISLACARARARVCVPLTRFMEQVAVRARTHLLMH